MVGLLSSVSILVICSSFLSCSGFLDPIRSSRGVINGNVGAKLSHGFAWKAYCNGCQKRKEVVFRDQKRYRFIATPAVSVDQAVVLADISDAASSAELSSVAASFQPRGITSADTAVFVVSVIPFLWATIEFWRRIAVGEPFGTGSDSVVIIGEEGDPSSSRGRRVLGKGAFIAAYVLFGIAAFVLILTAVAGVQVSATGTGAAADVVSGGVVDLSAAVSTARGVVTAGKGLPMGSMENALL